MKWYENPKLWKFLESIPLLGTWLRSWADGRENKNS